MRDAGLSDKTQTRYYLGLRKLLRVLKGVQDELHMDDLVSDWVQRCWIRGESLHVVSDALCAVHHFEPSTRRKLPNAWRLFSIWRKLEAPNRAPPLVERVVLSWAMYAVEHCNLEFACMILLGFYALLRTGEMLKVTPNDLIIGQNSAIVTLIDTKTGKRNAAQEVVAFEHPVALEILRALIEIRKEQYLQHLPLWSKSAQAFRNQFSHHCSRFDLSGHLFRPYSLRRGGATHMFQQCGSMEQCLLKGRWGSSKVARVYLMDGLSCLPHPTFTPRARRLLEQYAPINQLAGRGWGRGGV